MDGDTKMSRLIFICEMCFNELEPKRKLGLTTRVTVTCSYCKKRVPSAVLYDSDRLKKCAKAVQTTLIT